MKPATPYQRAAALYVAAGWSPIPIAAQGQGKGTTPGGCSGYSGEFITANNLDGWLERAGSKYPNVALRLPRTVLGIDVDAYGIKKGARQLEILEDELGYLPPTWSSTARGPAQPARIWFFRVPGEFKYKIPPRRDIDLIQYHHRQAVVWPSPHHSGATYWWYRPDGSEADEAELPTPDDLAELPARWVDRLRVAERSTSDRTIRVDASNLDGELERLYGEYPPAMYCDTDRLDWRLAPLAEATEGSRHDRMVSTMGRIGDDVVAGYYPPRQAVEALVDAFCELVGGDRGEHEAKSAACYVLEARRPLVALLNREGAQR